MRAGPFGTDEQGVMTPSHIALVHYGEQEMRDRVLDFLKPALADPTQAVYLCGAPGDSEELLAFLAASTGREFGADIADRRIVLGRGDPDADRQLQNLMDPVRELCGRGFSTVRVVGPAAWDVPGYSAPEDFLWYESRILPAIEGLPVAIMCTYDAAALPGPALVYGALETHTHTVINGVVSESPAFVPADRYLQSRLIHLPWLESRESN